MRQLNSAEWRRLLRLFVAGAEEMRPVMMTPFERDGWVCATDSHVLIRVDKKYITDDYFTDKKTPDVKSVMPQYNPQLAITKTGLIQALTKLNLDYNETKTECPYCDEECEVEWEYTDSDDDKHTMWGECPCCKGSGYLRNGINRFCELNGANLNAHYLILLYNVMTELSIDKATVTIGDMRQLRFNIAQGVDIVMMPCILNKKRSKSVANIKTTKL